VLQWEKTPNSFSNLEQRNIKIECKGSKLLQRFRKQINDVLAMSGEDKFV
jgi:hypothetical protein